MQNHHKAWLQNHPERTEEWLKERLADGFDVHHLNGNHSHDDPNNLVLIECADHMRLHGSTLSRILSQKDEARIEKTLSMGKSAYDAKDQLTSWAEIGKSLFPASAAPDSYARSLAKQYALSAEIPFPKPDSNMRLPNGKMRGERN